MPVLQPWGKSTGLSLLYPLQSSESTKSYLRKPSSCSACSSVSPPSSTGSGRRLGHDAARHKGRLVRVGPVRIAISALAPFRPPGWGSVGCRTFVELNLSGALDAPHHQGDLVTIPPLYSYYGAACPSPFRHFLSGAAPDIEGLSHTTAPLSPIHRLLRCSSQLNHTQHKRAAQPPALRTGSAPLRPGAPCPGAAGDRRGIALGHPG